MSTGRPRVIPPAEDLRSGASRILPEALTILRDSTGLDFSGYRRGTLERRLSNRMVARRAGSAEGYLAILRGDADEASRLAANLTIKVTKFYRNAAVFGLLSESILPALRRDFAEPLRAWSAGCATGEEAYTLAAILGDAGIVVATDLDEDALVTASAGRYDRRAFDEAPPGFTEGMAHLTTDSRFLQVSPSTRKRVTFERHDVSGAEDPPSAPFHLVCCRNVLIYFAPALQERALRLLIRNLVPGGVLCLGEAEWPPASIGQLEVIDRKHRIFRRIVPEEVRP